MVRRSDRLPMLRLHQFHRPGDGTSGELGFIRPRSSSSFLLYMNPNNTSSVYLFDIYQTNNYFLYDVEIRAAHIFAFLA